MLLETIKENAKYIFLEIIYPIMRKVVEIDAVEKYIDEQKYLKEKQEEVDRIMNDRYSKDSIGHYYWPLHLRPESDELFDGNTVLLLKVYLEAFAYSNTHSMEKHKEYLNKVIKFIGYIIRNMVDRSLSNEDIRNSINVEYEYDEDSDRVKVVNFYINTDGINTFQNIFKTWYYDTSSEGHIIIEKYEFYQVR